MTLDELLHQLRAYRLILISPSEVWPSPWVTPQVRHAIRRHRKGLKLLIAWSDIATCPARDLHRKYWRYIPGEKRFVCEICTRLLEEVS